MRFVIVIIFLSFSQLQSQSSLQKGFRLLDAQSYDEAASFFENYLNDDPDNKTAKICLGRAKGLGGDTASAQDLFSELKESHPDDIEVKLNLAESFLWAKDAKPAVEIYTEILSSEPENLTAVFGKANALAELKLYEEALPLIDKAIELDPKNPNAKTSRRFILYGVADNKRKKEEYKSAISVLDIVLEEYRNDEQALINKGICYLSMNDVKTAEWIFNYMQERDINNFETSLLLSHVSLLKHKNKDAISYANMAIKLAEESNSEQVIRANIQRVNTLGASKDFKTANSILKSLETQYEDHNDIQLAKARMLIWDQEYNDGLDAYAAVKDSNYVFRMGLAEAHRAQHYNLQAINQIEEALKIIPNQPDALRLLREIKLDQSTSIKLTASTSSDIGMNDAKEYFINVIQPIKEKHSLLLDVGLRKTSQAFTGLNAEQKRFIIGDRFRLSPKIEIIGKAGLLNFNSDDNTTSTSYVYELKLNYKLTKHHAFGISNSREPLKYSSDLIRSSIFNNSSVLNYTFSKHRWPGLYLQYEKAFQTDENSRDIIFASLFYQIKTFPLLKSGVNYTQMTYDFSQPTLYFSPDNYSVIEAFVQFGNDFDRKAKFIYHLEATYGKQKLEQDPRINTSRFTVETGYRFSDKIELRGQYFYSTAANSTNKGFSFTRWQAALKVIL